MPPETADELAVVGLTADRFSVLVLALGMILFCAACAMVAAWAR